MLNMKYLERLFSFSLTNMGYRVRRNWRSSNSRWRTVQHDCPSHRSVLNGLAVAEGDHAASAHRNAAHRNTIPESSLSAHDG